MRTHYNSANKHGHNHSTHRDTELDVIVWSVAGYINTWPAGCLAPSLRRSRHIKHTDAAIFPPALSPPTKMLLGRTHTHAPMHPHTTCISHGGQVIHISGSGNPACTHQSASTPSATWLFTVHKYPCIASSCAAGYGCAVGGSTFDGQHVVDNHRLSTVSRRCNSIAARSLTRCQTIVH